MQSPAGRKTATNRPEYKGIPFMVPIGDDDTSRRTVAMVTYALIVFHVLSFFLEQSGGDALIVKWAFVPSRFLANPFGDCLTLITSM